MDCQLKLTDWDKLKQEFPHSLGIREKVEIQSAALKILVGNLENKFFADYAYTKKGIMAFLEMIHDNAKEALEKGAYEKVDALVSQISSKEDFQSFNENEVECLKEIVSEMEGALYPKPSHKFNQPHRKAEIFSKKAAREAVKV